MEATRKYPKTSRFAAIETLLRLNRTRYPVKPLFDSVTDECRLIGAERSLAMNLIYGVLRRRDYLDLLIGKLCNRPLDQLEPFVYQALSVGLYQLFCLDRIPESAAVNETVNALKAASLKKHLHGFVNGVLRAATRQRDTLPGPDDTLSSGAPILNHPAWLTDRWRDRYGQDEMERICRVNSREPRLTLRVNTLKIDRNHFANRLQEDGITAIPGHYAPDSLVLTNYQGSISALPGYDEGCFQVQDEAAQLATLLLGPFTSQMAYLDGCAGLGGKTSHILQLMAPNSRVVAVEPEPQRLRLLQENLDRLAPERQLTICPTNLQEYLRTSRLQFDRVLIDAPCSGTGVIGRHPDIRWNRQPDDLIGYQLEQLDLLDNAAELVAPEGVIVYATCSIEIEENQQVMERFLAAHPGFSLTSCRGYLPETAVGFLEGDVFAPRPTGEIDGFFAARFMRTS
ncbi:16S rRNA (cytosine(967)-C(5))-methyltransferase RsmB [Desulfopila aestuarii]|uniref:16S rRNA (cytosine(967)-C(5))-methyltransferase n=1 Tax=Desulfopila aestuarii DSM 18488 TaxID=1121416 RepID=A0A1M7Y8T5_9BACT|nr:16S rRNA (cytosine(967)-C(5))-methyltransferase RsmB [Desulfopila aestuarii]SHO49055.1 16S rRNA (cytosine967-C5)-methyltransferase [Desulfopila aestuarii DSM 18488]